MSKPVLRITPKKYGGETTVISMRIAKEMLREIDNVAAATGRTRNELMMMSLEFALDNMQIVVGKDEDAGNGVD